MRRRRNGGHQHTRGFLPHHHHHQFAFSSSRLCVFTRSYILSPFSLHQLRRCWMRLSCAQAGSSAASTSVLPTNLSDEYDRLSRDFIDLRVSFVFPDRGWNEWRYRKSWRCRPRACRWRRTCRSIFCPWSRRATQGPTSWTCVGTPQSRPSSTAERFDDSPPFPLVPPATQVRNMFPLHQVVNAQDFMGALQMTLPSVAKDEAKRLQEWRLHA
jgi:hypothetical protein